VRPGHSHTDEHQARTLAGAAHCPLALGLEPWTWRLGATQGTLDLSVGGAQLLTDPCGPRRFQESSDPWLLDTRRRPKLDMAMDLAS
jgi:hypothetical protein